MIAVPAEKIGVKGLNEFSRAIKRVDAELPKMLRVAMNGAADLLITKAKPKIPRRTGRAAGTLKAKSTRTAVRVGVGGDKAPYYPFLDFGGSVGPNKSVKRPFYREGRYLYPTLREQREEFVGVMDQALTDIVKRAGLEVT